MVQWVRICLQGRSCRRCGFNPGLGNPPKDGMATHSSILVWEIRITLPCIVEMSILGRTRLTD